MSQHQCCCPDTNMFVNVKNMSDIRSYNSVSNFDSECQFPDSSNISARSSVPTSSYSSFTPGRPRRCPSSPRRTWRIPSWRRPTSMTPSLRSWIPFQVFTVGQADVSVLPKLNLLFLVKYYQSLCLGSTKLVMETSMYQLCR